MDILNLIIKELRHYENEGIVTYFIPVIDKYKYYTIVTEKELNKNTTYVQSKYVIRLINNIIKLIKRYTLDIDINFHECEENNILYLEFQIGGHKIRMVIKSVYGHISVVFNSRTSYVDAGSIMSLTNIDKLEDIIENLTKNSSGY